MARHRLYLELELEATHSVLEASQALDLIPELVALLLAVHQLLFQAAELTLQPH